MSRPVPSSNREASSSAAGPAGVVRVAVVGCGAVARANLLPVLAGHDGVRLVALVDRDLGRARDLAKAYGVPRAVTDLDDVMDEVDGVVLATPPAHHAEATVALASRGKHVLVEKPMAIAFDQASQMVEAAERNGVALSVGLYRRMLPSVRLLRALLESGDYGRPLAVDAEEGGAYGWNLATLDVLTREKGGGGVLIDIGSHLLDVILYALPGEPRLVTFTDNNRGGIETDCVTSFSLRLGAVDIPVRMELSRTRELRGSIRIQCERATLELERPNFTQVRVHPADSTASDSTRSSPFHVTAEFADQKPYIGYQGFRAEIDDWVKAIADRTDPELSGRSVLPVVKLIEDCYRHRTSLIEPWTDEGLATPHPAPTVTDRRRRVLVTGAGGFLGGRAVELLGERYGWDVVALVREPRSAARLARWPANIVVGDISSQADMDRVLPGCDAVVHCAVGTSWKPAEVRRVTVDGTRTVAEAALRAGVKRFVHISTMFVHRRDGGGVLDENVPLEPPARDGYAQNKLLAERVVQELGSKGLSTITLRPSRIYGPFSRTFTVRPLQAMSEGHFVIKGDPNIPANMVYVDNVVHAIASALEAPDRLGGRAYLVSEPDQLSLYEFFAFFAASTNRPIRVIPDVAVPSGGRAEAGVFGRWLAGCRTIVLAPEVRALIHRIMDTDPVGALPRRLWDSSPRAQAALLRLFRVDAAVMYRVPADAAAADSADYGDAGLVSTARASQELGFVPEVDGTRAMELTRQWAEYARLLPMSAGVTRTSPC